MTTRPRQFALLLVLALAAAACGGSTATTAPAATEATGATAAPDSTASPDAVVSTPPDVEGGTDGCDRISDAAIEDVLGAKIATAETASQGGCLWTSELSDAFPIEGTVDLQVESNGQAALDELRQFQGAALTEETSLGVPASFGPADALFFVVDDQMLTLQVLAYGVDGHAAALTLAKALIAGG